MYCVLTHCFVCLENVFGNGYAYGLYLELFDFISKFIIDPDQKLMNCPTLLVLYHFQPSIPEIIFH